MSTMKMFAALLVTAGMMQTLATQAKAATPPKLESSRHAEAGCGWKHPYNYRYHYHYSLRRPSPYQHPHAPYVRRKPNPND